VTKKSPNEKRGARPTNLLHRRSFLRSIGKLFGSGQGAALTEGLASPSPAARAGGWVSRRRGVRGAASLLGQPHSCKRCNFKIRAISATAFGSENPPWPVGIMSSDSAKSRCELE
jgi:hypothetical protein